MSLKKQHIIFITFIVLSLINFKSTYALSVKIETLSTFPSSNQIFKSSFTGCLKDTGKVSYVSKNKTKFYINVNDNIVGPFHGVSQITPLFNQTDGSYAYIIFNKDKTKAQAVINGKKTKWYDKIADIAPIPNNGFALHVVEHNKTGIAFNTKKPELFFDYLIFKNNFKITKDNKNYIYSALNKNKWQLIFNGKPILKTDKKDQIITPFMSEDGQNKGAVIRGKDFSQIWYNGNFTKKWDNIINPSFIDNFKLIFIGIKNKKAGVIYAGKRNLYDLVTKPLISPENNFVVYSVKNNDKWQMVFNDKISDKKFDIIGGYSFSPDEKTLFFTAKKNNKSGLYIFGKNEKPDLFKSVSLPVFSNKGRMAYKAVNKKEEFLIENNAKSPKFNEVSSPYFTDTGVRYCVVKNKDNKFSFMKENIKPKKYYDFIIGPYSKNGLTVFQAKEKDNWFLIINGEETDLNLKGFLKNTPVEITENNEVNALGLNKNREIVLVTVGGIETKH